MISLYTTLDYTLAQNHHYSADQHGSSTKQFTKLDSIDQIEESDVSITLIIIINIKKITP